MPTIIEISLADFLAKYARNNLSEVVVINVSGQQRVYGRTTEGQVENQDGYLIVYAVL